LLHKSIGHIDEDLSVNIFLRKLTVFSMEQYILRLKGYYHGIGRSPHIVTRKLIDLEVQYLEIVKIEIFLISYMLSSDLCFAFRLIARYHYTEVHQSQGNNTW